MTTDLGSLLQRASAARFGPLSLTCRIAGNGWSLTVQLNPREPVIVEASRDASSGAFCLERRFAAAAEANLRDLIDSAPWVMDLNTAGIGVALRLWLHAEDLQMNTLLPALAYFASLDERELDGQVGQVIADPLVAADSETRPVVPVRPLAWQSFATISAEAAPTTAPEPVASTQIDQPSPEPAVKSPAVVEAPVALQAQAPPSEAATAPAIPEPEGLGGNCRECGSPFPPDHTFCTTCGARLT